MPRKPTLLARKAKSELLQNISELPAGSSLPTMQELGERFDLHASTIFRMLRDLADAGSVWQNPGGRFFSAASRNQILKGAPICFVGREMWKWSNLYHELIEGIAGVCSANGSPLVLLSTPSLVRQSDPAEPPLFASASIQKKELRPLLAASPRGCAGFILDHLWSEDALAAASFPGGDHLQLLFGSNPNIPVIAPDEKAGIELVHSYLAVNKFDDVVLVNPFKGDPAIDASTRLLREELKAFRLREIPYCNIGAEIKCILAYGKKRTCMICPEDNTSLAISNLLDGKSGARRIQLLATQGTGMICSPIHRLHHDYKHLGKSAAEAILHGLKCNPMPPRLLT